MDYKQTKLWLKAFETPATNSNSNELTFFSNAYERMRERAKVLTSRISSDLPHMTIHDVTHLDALWEMASIAAGESFELNPAEAFVFGCAVLIHDAAMSLAAFPGGVAELKCTIEWKDLYARHLEALGDEGMADLHATEEALRFLHGKHAESLMGIYWHGAEHQQVFLLEDMELRNFYGAKIGKVAHSHWWPISKVENELSQTLGAIAGKSSYTVDLLKVACLLRVADALHLDSRRAPSFDFALMQPKGVSEHHWKFQNRMSKPHVRNDAIVFTAQPPFGIDDSDAWWTAFDALKMVDRELRDVDRVLRDHNKTPLIVRRIEGAYSPNDLARHVETTGWDPVDSTIKVSNIPSVVSTLGGKKLYGDVTDAPIREIIQNGLDAITARRKLQGRRKDWGELKVALEQRQDGFWLAIEDNGVGMSPVVLTGPLIDFGNSFWKSWLSMQEFPGLAASGMNARGKYGIGFFSAFMLGDHVRVVSRRFDNNQRSAKVLEFKNGLSSRPNLLDAASNEAPIDGGTRVEIKLTTDPYEDKGILSKKRLHSKPAAVHLSELVASIAPATDVAILEVRDGQEIPITDVEDWLTISSSELLNRISLDQKTTADSGYLPDLQDMRDENGQIYGRARISASRGFLSKSGLIVVDGLAAKSIDYIDGILEGRETTASRSVAFPTVPAAVLAEWASKQAELYANTDISDDKKATIAAIVLACGGSVGGLPIVNWLGRWMSADEFSEEAATHESILLHHEPITYEDGDDVSAHKFDAEFEKLDHIAEVKRIYLPSANETNWIGAVTKGEGIHLDTFIHGLLGKVWGEVETYPEITTVGEVDDIEIDRFVTVCRREIVSDQN